MGDDVWLVLPDKLSTRLFFDSGIVARLSERLGTRLALLFLLAEDEAREWTERVPGTRVLDAHELESARPGIVEKVARRIDRIVDKHAGYYPLAIRLNYRHGFHLDRMAPGHRNWMLDSARVGRLPRWGWIERAMERRHFSPRRQVPTALLARMKEDCGALVLTNVQPRDAVPFLLAARRLHRPVVAHVASWDHTVGKGVIPPFCEVYLVQNRAMEEDLSRYHGIASERVVVTGWPQTDVYFRRRSREDYVALLRSYGLDSERPLVVVMGNTPTNAPYEGRFVERLVSWWEEAWRTRFSLLFRPHPRDSEWRERFAAARDRPGVHVQEASFTDLEQLATLLQHCDCVVANAGTILLEALVNDRPAVCVLYDEGGAPGESWALKNVLGEHYRELAQSEAFYRAERFEDVVAGIEHALANPEELAGERSRVVREVVGHVDGRAAERVADAIAAAVGAHPGPNLQSSQSDSRESATSDPAARPRRPLLTVVVPVYNGGDEIVENVGVIRRAAAGDLAPEDVELVVVSDGSIDGTSERLLAARSDVDMRVIHYDRNLGKGYAVKLGALAASGRWVAIVDADLDLDPAAIPAYLDTAQREDLDFAIGSKRHPDSVVHYPRSRRVASWCYQQLNRMLFRLDVRDTQVGLKVFRREVADEVVPLLLVKQFAFDLELLAVGRALGFRRVRELPVRLEYQFTGSEVRSGAVARALWDTAAVFYRLRILRTYQRKRRLLGSDRLSQDELPLVTVLGNAGSDLLDYPRLEFLPSVDRADAGAARGEVLAVLGEGARPAGNWVAAAVPFFSREDVSAVVVPTLVPPDASVRERAAAAVLESRLGGGSRRSRYLPGNVRVTDDYPADSFVVRKTDFLAATREGVDDAELVGWLAERGRRTVYTPDTMVSAAPAPLFAPHLRATVRHAAARGAAARRTRAASVSSATTLSLVPAGCALAGVVLAVAGPQEARRAGAGLVAAYGALVVGSAGLAAARFRSVPVGALAAPALVATQAAYVGGFLRGLALGR